MILVAEVVLLIYGIVALFKGEFSAGKGKTLRGMGARFCGLLCMAPLPLSFVVGFAVGIYLVASGTAPQSIQKDYWGTFAGIEVGILVLCGIAVVVLSKMLYKRQEEREGLQQGTPDPEEEMGDNKWDEANG